MRVRVPVRVGVHVRVRVDLRVWFTHVLCVFFFSFFVSYPVSCSKNFDFRRFAGVRACPAGGHSAQRRSASSPKGAQKGEAKRR